VRVAPFETEEEALSLANLVMSPTAAYIWSADPQRARRLVPAFEPASVWVNSHNPQDRLTATADEVNIGCYMTSRSVFVAADDTPVPPLGA
jgi:acyl-CoA reductase-like NAD-dependent aldehyde dehydrogenase